MRKFLGFANYFRKFLQGYAGHVAPLNALLKNDVAWRWAAAEEAAFAWAKNALQTAPVLAMPNFAQPFEVRCDASGFGTGAVLMQGDRAVAYLSKGFTSAERNYTTGEQELLAVVRALASWRCYLEGGAHPVTVVTDHQPLTYMPTKCHLSRRQARWSEFMSRFELVWEHRPGRINIADPLSRKPSLMFAAMSTRAAAAARQAPAAAAKPTPAKERPDSAEIESDFADRLRASYESDEWLKVPKNNQLLSSVDGFWWYSKGKNSEVKLLYVPDVDGLRAECLTLVHDHPFSGHAGITKTTEQFQRSYWWPQWRAQVEQYVQKCDSCQRHKPTNLKPAGLLQPLPIPGRPWESVSMDFITHLPETERGHTSIYVVVDRLTKLTHIMATRDTVTGAEVAQLFIDNIVRLHGLPRDIISDRDSKFRGKFWTAFTQRMGIDRKMSTARHPQTDGQTERYNRVIQEMMRHYIGPTQNDWDNHLTAIEFAINNAYHESIKTTPFRFNYGQNPLTPASLRIPKVDNPVAMQLTTSLQQRIKEAKICLEAAQQRQKANADRHRRDAKPEDQLKVGDQVLLNSKGLRFKGPGTPKFGPQWRGPYTIIEKIGAVAFRLQLPKGLKVHNVFHESLLKRYRSDGTVQPPRDDWEADAETEYIVEMLLGHAKRTIRKGKKINYYLCKWQDWAEEHNTWEPETELQRNCSELIDAYWELVNAQAKSKSAPSEAGAKSSKER